MPTEKTGVSKRGGSDHFVMHGSPSSWNLLLSTFSQLRGQISSKDKSWSERRCWGEVAGHQSEPGVRNPLQEGATPRLFNKRRVTSSFPCIIGLIGRHNQRVHLWHRPRQGQLFISCDLFISLNPSIDICVPSKYGHPHSGSCQDSLSLMMTSHAALGTPSSHHGPFSAAAVDRQIIR